ncbi:MAG: DUF3891 family protein [Methylocella sp.]
MLLRKDGLDVIAIPQPSHAWLSGQMARVWGNEHFAAPAPYDEVCLAAGQHDIGWLDWEMAPALDARTGLPQEFSKVPPAMHTALWREGVRHARAFGRYPALLVSLHANTIYARHFDFAKASPENAQTVRAFLDEQHCFQAWTAASLRADPKLAEQASPETLEHNRLLIAALDWMSLVICWGVNPQCTNGGGPNDRPPYAAPRRRPGHRSLAFPDSQRRGSRRGQASARPIRDASGPPSGAGRGRTGTRHRSASPGLSLRTYGRAWRWFNAQTPKYP